MTSNNLTCQQYSRYFFSISIHAVFSAASHKCYKVITMIVIKENYCLCNCLIKCDFILLKNKQLINVMICNE